MNDGNMSLVLFTLLFQCAVGMSIFAACHARCTDIYAKNMQKFWKMLTFLTGLSLVISLFHLSKPWAAPTALRNIGASWLSMEILFASLFFLLTIVVKRKLRSCDFSASSACSFFSKKLPCLMKITALIGCIGLIIQGLTYAPIAMPAIANAFPTVLFILSALIMGAGFFRMLFKEQCSSVTAVYTTSIWILLTLLFVVPCVWASGSEIFYRTAVAWVSSANFWWGSMFLVLALYFVKKERPHLSVLCAVLGLLFGRVVFFERTLHIACILGG